MYEIYCKLRDERKVKDADVVKETGITKSTFSDWKTGRSKPKPEKLQKIADYFGVTVDYLMTGTTGNSICSPCPDCGLWYDANDPEDVKHHMTIHADWQKAVEKYGKLYCNSIENEKIKATNRLLSHDTSLSLDERCEAQIKVLRCLFSRSIEANGYNLEHVPFDIYVAMMLGNTAYIDNNLEGDLFQALVNKYGTKPGIDSGSIYHIPKAKKSKLTSSDERDIKKDVDSIMNKLTSKEYGPAAYDGQELDPEAAELFRDELELALRRLKIINKEKYTPKKYKK